MKVTPVPASAKTQAEYKEFNDLGNKEFLREFSSTLLPKEEIALDKLVFTDPTQAGEKMFVLLAWATGAFAEELLQLKWPDVMTLPEVNPAHCFIQIHSPGNDNPRFVPIGERLKDFFLIRMTSIVSKYEAAHEVTLDAKEKGELLSSMYICCDGADNTKPCSLEKAQQATRETLLQAGVKQEAFRYLDLYRKFVLAIEERPRETMTEIFFLRRTFSTICHAFGLTEEEVSYMMKLPLPYLSADELVEKYNNGPAKRLETIAKKHVRRVIFTPLPGWYDPKRPIKDPYDDRYVLQLLYDLYVRSGGTI